MSYVHICALDVSYVHIYALDFAIQVFVLFFWHNQRYTVYQGESGEKMCTWNEQWILKCCEDWLWAVELTENFGIVAHQPILDAEGSLDILLSSVIKITSSYQKVKCMIPLHFCGRWKKKKSFYSKAKATEIVFEGCWKLAWMLKKKKKTNEKALREVAEHQKLNKIKIRRQLK